MSEREKIEFLRDIDIAIERIENYVKGLTYADFLTDLKTQDATIRNLEIIGEAVKHLPNDFRKRYPQIPWKKIAGARDRLIHGYFGVNFDIVWTIITEDFPSLKLALKKILVEYE